MATSFVEADLAGLRGEFAGLGPLSWLNCQGAAPGATSVVAAVDHAIRSWAAGTFDWHAWEDAAEDARERFAHRIGASPDDVSLMTSLAEAASTVATGLVSRAPRLGDRRHIVASATEFRSNLFPWQALGSAGFSLRLIPPRDGGLTTSQVLDAIETDVALVALSDVQSQTGARLNVRAIVDACRDAGCWSFVNLTQSLGVLPFDLRTCHADFVAAHGYKWLLAPRGATWLYARAERRTDLRALTPNWKNVPRPYAVMYGLADGEEDTARRLDASLAWHSWVGASAALELLDSVDADAVRDRSLGLAAACRVRLAELGARLARSDLPTHLLAIRLRDVAAATRKEAHLRKGGVVTSSRGPWLRIGFHGFNTMNDVDRVTELLR